MENQRNENREGGYVIYCSDTETTGLDPLKNEIIELSMSRLIPEGDEYRRQQRSWLIRAMNPTTVEDEALAVSGHKREDILHISQFGKDNYKDPSEVLKEITVWMMDDDVSSVDRIFSGQNPTFDLSFLIQFWRLYGKIESFPFSCERNNRMLDLKQLVILFDICTGRRRKAYNLGSLVKAIGVKKGRAHRADEDVRMTEDSIMKMVGMIRPTVRESFKDAYLSEDVV